MPKPDPEHAALIVKPQHLSNSPGMADGTVGPDILVTLIDGMVRAGKEKEIATPSFPNMDEGDIFRRPWIKLIKLVWRPDRPFLDVADHVLSRGNWL